MNTVRLAPHDRRALRLGVLLLTPALLFSFGVRPYLAALVSTQNQIDRERELLRRERTLLAGIRFAPAQVQRAEGELLHEAPRLFGGPDLGAASAALANHVGGVAAAHRVMIQQSETQAPDTVGDGVARIRVELRAMSDLEGILTFLHSLEAGPKLLTVERIAIARAEQLNGDPKRDEEILGLSATVAGYVVEAAR